MLERALLFRHAFSRLQDVDDDYKLCPSEEEWHRVGKIVEFLRLFYDMTLLFSGSKYPTANLYFPNVWKIQCLLNKEVNSPDVLISEMASNMKIKFQKMKRFLILNKSCFICSKSTLKNNTAITAAPMESTFNSDDGQTRDLMDGFDVYQSQQGANGNKSELKLYLEERLVDRKQQPDLNVLTYWKESRIRYPELSLMARDILSIHITTVASESAFSHGGRILGKLRTSMLPDNVEALLCS
ncbi:zinc finger BED domain-containing protein DAYSLEEPER-like [Coffea arabica]|uniref:Zinc finger BED domain-containing protein DAYSLEEPER-like n=1 Tax=Coffea arabica TaxID=13443 RepID=A0A6P6UFC1_COFAR